MTPAPEVESLMARLLRGLAFHRRPAAGNLLGSSARKPMESACRPGIRAPELRCCSTTTASGNFAKGNAGVATWSRASAKYILRIPGNSALQAGIPLRIGTAAKQHLPGPGYNATLQKPSTSLRVFSPVPERTKCNPRGRRHNCRSSSMNARTLVLVISERY